MSRAIEHNFRSHTPLKNTLDKMDNVREKCKELALEIDDECPNSREKAIALTRLEEVMFFANASLARE